ncbi:MAG: hypothetical protein HOW73_03595 [Polyangiaceae bacterium]|nr:hypothetical protein [Polyangiaceae bacterium]
MPEWHAPISSFAKANGYVFWGDLAFCTVKAPVKGATVELWISAMGSGRARATIEGTFGEYGVIYCRAKAKLVAELDVEVRRKTVLDRLISRGRPSGNAEFDAKYVALGNADHLRRLLTGTVVDAFVGMWKRTQGLCVEDQLVALEGGQFSLAPTELAFIVETVGTIAAAGTG